VTGGQQNGTGSAALLDAAIAHFVGTQRAARAMTEAFLAQLGALGGEGEIVLDWIDDEWTAQTAGAGSGGPLAVRSRSKPSGAPGSVFLASWVREVGSYAFALVHGSAHPVVFLLKTDRRRRGDGET